MATISVNSDHQFIPTASAEEEPNSENSTQAQAGQLETSERPEAEPTMHSMANGSESNPSGERGSNPSQDTMEELRSKIYETQATNESFRSQNIVLSQRIIRITR